MPSELGNIACRQSNNKIQVSNRIHGKVDRVHMVHDHATYSSMITCLT